MRNIPTQVEKFFEMQKFDIEASTEVINPYVPYAKQLNIGSPSRYSSIATFKEFKNEYSEQEN